MKFSLHLTKPREFCTFRTDFFPKFKKNIVFYYLQNILQLSFLENICKNDSLYKLNIYFISIIYAICNLVERLMQKVEVEIPILRLIITDVNFHSYFLGLRKMFMSIRTTTSSCAMLLWMAFSIVNVYQRRSEVMCLWIFE